MIGILAKSVWGALVKSGGKNVGSKIFGRKDKKSLAKEKKS